MFRCKVPKSMSRQVFQKRVDLVLQSNLNENHIMKEKSLASNNISNDSYWPWSDFESDSDGSEDEQEKVRTWFSDIREWSLRNQVNHQTLNDLLGILRFHNVRGIPKDARTMLRTPKTHVIQQISGGTYWYNGISKNLSLMYSGNKNKPKEISMMFNVDGLPISRSSQSQFWPIMGQVYESEYGPFFIGIFHGYTKPKNLDEYLSTFVTELNDLLENGIAIDGEHIVIECRCFLCDAPAKSFVKCNAYHNSYFGCNFCCVEGIYDDNRMSYNQLNCALRTDESFRNQLQEEHHKGKSILEALPINMVTDFPNDYLHLILLGIQKTLLKIWTLGNNYNTKLSAPQIALVNMRLLNFAKSQPNEFARKIRTLDCLKHWKGTELRTFLLYTGPVALKDILSPEAYYNFLALHCAVRICSSSMVDSHLVIAKQLFKIFAEGCIEIYGEQCMSHNFHNIIHVVNDVKKFGKLDSYSCFPFESKLFALKNLLRKGDKPLAQVINRLSELELLHPKKIQTQKNMLAKEMKSEKDSYEELFHNKMRYNKTEKNKWMLMNNNEIVEFEKAINIGEKTYVLGSKIKKTSNLYETPLRSSLLDIYASDGITGSPQMFPLESIKTKMFLMQSDDGVVFSPLLHNE